MTAAQTLAAKLPASDVASDGGKAFSRLSMVRVSSSSTVPTRRVPI